MDSRPPSAALLRYLLLQVPGLFLTGAALLLLHRWLALPAWLAWTILALWAAKDAALFPFVWRSYLPGDRGAADAMIGLVGEAVEEIDPSGRVLVRGELWAARLDQGSPGVGKGEAVTVRGVRGLTVLVSPARRGRPGTGAGRTGPGS